jgi:hypothetical protein
MEHLVGILLKMTPFSCLMIFIKAELISVELIMEL